MASDTRTLKVVVTGDSKDAQQALHKVGDAGHQSEGKLGRLVATMGRLAVLGTAAFMVGASTGLVKSVMAASDLNETVNKTNVIFGKNAGEILKWSESSAKSFGLSKQAALESVSSFGNMFQQLGFTGDQALNMSTSVVKLATDLGSFNNLPTEEVLDMMAAGFRGEYDSLQRLIPTINAASVEQEAMNMTGKENAKALTQQEKAAATMALIMKGAASAENDFAETSGGLANKMKILKASVMDVAAQIGQYLLPIVTAIVGFIADQAVPAFGGLIKALAGEGITSNGLVGFMERVGVEIRAAALAIKEFVTSDAFIAFLENAKIAAANLYVMIASLVTKLIDLGKWMIEHEGIILLIVAAITAWIIASKTLAAIALAQVILATIAASGGLSAYIAQIHAVRVAKALWAAVSAVVAAAIWVVNAALAANPIGIVIIAIVALVAAFVILWKTNEGFRDIVIAVWNAIRTAVGAVVDWFVANVLPTLKAVWDGIAAAVTWLYQNVIVPMFQGWIIVMSAVFGWLRDTGWPILQAVFGVIGAAITFLYENVVRPYFNLWITVLSAVFGWIRDTGWPILQTVFNAIATIVIWLYQNVFKPNFDLMRLVVEVTFNWIRDTAWPVLQQVLNLIGTAIGALRTLWDTNWNLMRAVMEAVVGFLQTNIVPRIQQAFALIGTLLVAMWNAFQANWNLIRGIIDAVTGFVQTTIVPRIQQAFAAMVAALVAMWTAFQANWNLIRGIVDSVTLFFSGTIVPRVQQVFAAIVAALVAMWQAFQTNWNLIRTHVETVVNFLRDVILVRIQQVFASIIAALISLWNAFRDNWTLIQEKVAAVVAFFTDTIVPNIQQAFQSIIDFLVNLWEQFNEYWTLINDKVNEVIDSVVSKVEDGRNRLEAIFQAIRTFALALKDDVVRYFTEMAEGVRGGINAMIGVVNAAIRAVNTILPKDIPQIPGVAEGGAVALATGGAPKMAGIGKNARMAHRVFGPGSYIGDHVPAMLSPGEHIVSAREVRGVGGHEALERMRAKWRMGQKWADSYADGGAVGIPGFALGAGVRPGMGRDLGGWRGLQALIMKWGNPNGGSFSSGYRAGDPLWHGSGLALDWGGYNQDALAQMFYNVRSQVLELIHSTPKANYGVSMGNRSEMGQQLWNEHKNHIHIAMNLPEIEALLGGAIPGAGGNTSPLQIPNPLIAIAKALINKLFAPMGAALNSALPPDGSLPNETARFVMDPSQLSAAVLDWALKIIPPFITAPGKGTDSGVSGDAQEYAKSRLGVYGWDINQWPPLKALWEGESNWNPNAVNPSSGAYGIPQILPSVHDHPVALGDHVGQITWGMNYIKGRYGTPQAAYDFWLSKNPHWYKQGGPIEQFSGGTNWAKGGITRLAEHGPELVMQSGLWNLARGAKVLSAATTSRFVDNGGWDATSGGRTAGTRGRRRWPWWMRGRRGWPWSRWDDDDDDDGWGGGWRRHRRHDDDDWGGGRGHSGGGSNRNLNVGGIHISLSPPQGMSDAAAQKMAKDVARHVRDEMAKIQRRNGGRTGLSGR